MTEQTKEQRVENLERDADELHADPTRTAEAENLRGAARRARREIEDLRRGVSGA